MGNLAGGYNLHPQVTSVPATFSPIHLHSGTGGTSLYPPLNVQKM